MGVRQVVQNYSCSPVDEQKDTNWELYNRQTTNTKKFRDQIFKSVCNKTFKSKWIYRIKASDVVNG